MQSARLPLPILATLAICVLGGCGTLGANSIKLQRDKFNQAIHQTSGDELLLNLVRLHHNEIPFFMNIDSVTGGASANIQASAGGVAVPSAPTNPFAILTGSTSYTESPSIGYKPLQGAELITQLNSPISAVSIVNMVNSDWPVVSILALTVEGLAKGHADHEAAKNEIRGLAQSDSLIVEATQGQSANSQPKAKKTVAKGASSETEKQQINVLTLYFSSKGDPTQAGCLSEAAQHDPLTFHKGSVVHWLRLLKIYRPEDIRGVTEANIAAASTGELKRIVSKLPDYIDIPAGSLLEGNGRRKAPMLRTRSALGALKNLAQKNTQFVTPERASEIIARHNMGACPSKDFYVADNNLRFYLLVQVSDVAPPGAFAMAYEKGKYYFVNDDISKKTMALMALITSVQATESSSGGPTPVYVINGR